MDGSRFDVFACALAAALTRREGLAIAVAAIAGGTLVEGGAAAAARCRRSGSSCSRASQCCTRYCEMSTAVPRRRRNRCGCPIGLVECNATCVDRTSDPANCGDCGVVCVGQEICLSGDCVCIPDCDGKVCGDDGCGGSCGSCDTGKACADDQAACIWPCADWNPAEDLPFCSASITGDRYDAYSAADTLVSCTADSQCQSHPLCGNGGFSCHCEYSVANEDYPTGEDWGQGWCVVVSTTKPACYDGGIEGKDLCGTGIDWVSFGFTSWVIDGRFGIGGGKCTSNQTCIDKAAECNNAGQRCFCEAASWDDGFFFRSNLNKAYCYRVNI